MTHATLATIALALAVLAILLFTRLRSSLGRVALLSIAAIAFFTYFGNSIPQLESPAPPAESAVTLGPGAPVSQWVKAGKEIVEGKGSCLLCHSIGSAGPRAPDLAGVGARAATRVSGLSEREYLRQSLLEPAAYVVEGYEPIMPPFDRPPNQLSAQELAAVVTHLQSLGGKPTAPNSEELAGAVAAAEAGGGHGPALSATEGVAGTTAEEIVAAAGCQACHVIGGEGGNLGPDLSDIGARADARYILESIVDPSAVVVPDCPTGPCPEGVMPAAFGQQLSAAQLYTLVNYLLEK
ncbi:MAG: c-type cytochrome [Anaerolineae bacterium]